MTLDERHRVDSPTASRLASRMFMQVAVQKCWQVIGWDVPTAFLQQDTKYAGQRKPVHMVPPHEIRQYEDEVWLMNKITYGLADAPRAWYFSICTFLKELGATQLPGEPCVFIFKENGELCGQILLHVHDGVMAGTGSRPSNAI